MNLCVICSDDRYIWKGCGKWVFFLLFWLFFSMYIFDDFSKCQGKCETLKNQQICLNFMAQNNEKQATKLLIEYMSTSASTLRKCCEEPHLKMSGYSLIPTT